MIWKISIIFTLSSLYSFGFSLPHVQKRDVSSTPAVTYEKDINNKILGVLKKVYPDLRNADSRSEQVPRTYGMSLTGEQGFVWNMLNDARKTFAVGEPSGKTVQKKEKNVIQSRSLLDEDDAEPQKGESVYTHILSGLLENDDFWNWLASWMDTYNEVLEEHIQARVEETVSEHLKEYFDRVDYLINDTSDSRDPDEDDRENESGHAAGAFVTTQHIHNSSVYNDYVTNVYLTDPRSEDDLLDKLAQAILAASDSEHTEDERK